MHSLHSQLHRQKQRTCCTLSGIAGGLGAWHWPKIRNSHQYTLRRLHSYAVSWFALSLEQ